ncbi:hypothetical protein [Sulfitobacter geojensis]|uniref:hypothetical protein n=1 Tax=Sulfitobacter geojensis TaxID=1342299 RepID=UPI000A47B9AE|nr:hypothetical protein [Sulfitobacter geojensis]
MSRSSMLSAASTSFDLSLCGVLAVDHEISDVDVLWVQFAGGELAQTAQCELAHGETG